MKQDSDNLEHLFAPSKTVALSASEHQELWESLKAYAEFHPAKQPSKKSFFAHSLYRFASVSVAGLTLFVGTAYAAQTSLPGDTLYPIKVEVVEPLLGTLETSEADKLAYQVALLERRLDEVQQLEVVAAEEPEVTSISSEYIEEHVSDLLEVVAMDSDESLGEELVLETLTRAKGIARAHDVIHDSITSNSADIPSVAKIDAAYETEATSFAEEHPAEALTYIESILDDFDEATATSTTDTPSEVTPEKLSEVADALKEGSIDEALSSASELQEELIVSEYLE